MNEQGNQYNKLKENDIITLSFTPYDKGDKRNFSAKYVIEKYVVEKVERETQSSQILILKHPHDKKTDNNHVVYKRFIDRNVYEQERKAYIRLFPDDESQIVYAIPKPLGFCDDDPPGILLEYLPTSLEERFAPLRIHAGGGDRSLLDNEILKLSYHMAAALKSLHDKGIIHRDIHSGNILFKDDQYWLIDFERVYFVGEDLGESADENAEEVIPESDIRDLGKILYRIYRGEHLKEDRYKADEQSLKTDFIKERFPLWFASLLSEMLSGRITDGNSLRNRLPELLEEEAEWLLSDQRWAMLSEHYAQSIAMHRSPGRYRLRRGVLRGFDVSADGAVLAVITGAGLWLRDIKHTQLLAYDETGYLPLTLAWEKCKQCSTHLLAVIYADRSTHIWQYYQKKENGRTFITVNKLLILPPLPNKPTSLAWGEGRKLAVGTEDGNIYVWKIEGGESYQYQQAYYISTQAGAIHAMSWLGADQLVFGGESGALYLWNEVEHPLCNELKRFYTEITGIISAGSGKILFTTAHGVVREYDIKTREMVEFATKHSTGITQILHIRRNQNGGIIFATVGAEGQINVWDTGAQMIEDGIDTNPPVAIYQRGSRQPAHLAAIDEDKTTSLLLLVGSENEGAIHQYQYHIPQPVKRIQKLRSLKIFDLPITTLAWLKDRANDSLYYLVTGNKAGTIEKLAIGSILVPGVEESQGVASDRETFAIDVRVLQEDMINIQPHAIRKISPAPGKTKVAIACNDFAIRMWDYEHMTIKTANTSGDATGAMAWHPLMNVLAYATEGAGVAFYWAGVQIVGEHLNPTGGYIRSLVFNTEGTQLAAISNTSSLRLINLESVGNGYFCPQDNGGIYQFYSSTLTALTWLPYTDKWLLANESGHIWLVNQDGVFVDLIRRRGHSHVIRFLVWHSPTDDSKRWKLAIVYSDHHIEVWNFKGFVDLKAEFREQKGEKWMLLPSGHTQPITDISFSSDGQWLASSSMDGSIIIYPLT